jgi:serine/threonine protein kinase
MESTWRVENYRIGRLLGKGGFGRVYLGTNEVSKEVFAVKVLAKSDILKNKMSDLVKSELDALACLESHQNIVGSVEVFASNKNIYIIMEPLFGGELLHYICCCSLT